MESSNTKVSVDPSAGYIGHLSRSQRLAQDHVALRAHAEMLPDLGPFEHLTSLSTSLYVGESEFEFWWVPTMYVIPRNCK